MTDNRFYTFVDDLFSDQRLDTLFTALEKITRPKEEESKKDFKVEIEVPGCKKEGIKIGHINDDLQLEIDGRSGKRFLRYPLSVKNYDLESFKSTLEDGILTIEVKRKAVETQKKREFKIS